MGGLGRREPAEAELGGVRFFVEEVSLDGAAAWPQGLDPRASRLATARATLREAERSEREERQRLGRAPVDGLTAAHAELLETRQTQSRAAAAQIEDLRRRALWLRQAISMGEEAIAAQRRLVDRLRRELADIGE